MSKSTLKSQSAEAKNSAEENVTKLMMSNPIDAPVKYILHYKEAIIKPKAGLVLGKITELNICYGADDMKKMEDDFQQYLDVWSNLEFEDSKEYAFRFQYGERADGETYVQGLILEKDLGNDLVFFRKIKKEEID